MKLAAALLVAASAVRADTQALPEWPGAAAGDWAAEPDWCAFADRIGTHNPAPVRLTATEFFGLENSCDITAALPTGVAESWALQLMCASEGEVYESQMLVMLTSPDEIYIYQGFEPTRFVRCASGDSK